MEYQKVYIKTHQDLCEPWIQTLKEAWSSVPSLIHNNIQLGPSLKTLWNVTLSGLSSSVWTWRFFEHQVQLAHQKKGIISDKWKIDVHFLWNDTFRCIYFFDKYFWMKSELLYRSVMFTWNRIRLSTPRNKIFSYISFTSLTYLLDQLAIHTYSGFRYNTRPSAHGSDV